MVLSAAQSIVGWALDTIKELKSLLVVPASEAEAASHAAASAPKPLARHWTVLGAVGLVRVLGAASVLAQCRVDAADKAAQSLRP